MKDIADIREYVQQYVKDNLASLIEEYITNNAASYDDIITAPSEGTNNE